jgi:hypothetical protein
VRKLERQARFLAAWRRVELRYQEGFCVSERGLQAYLVSGLELLFPEQTVVVEPRWATKDRHRIPDIVMLDGARITDIFELKFKPHHYPRFEDDLEKLLAYRANLETTFRLRIDPVSGGRSNSRFELGADCDMHFVAVANGGAAAVYPEEIIAKCPVPKGLRNRFNHWFGRTGVNFSGKENWDIRFGI